MKEFLFFFQPKPEFQSQNPILHPLRGGGQPEPTVKSFFMYNFCVYHIFICMIIFVMYFFQPLPQDNFYQPHEGHAPYSSQFGQNLPNIATPVKPPVEPLQSAIPPKVVEHEKPKAPIPEQHVHLKTVLDELKNQCYENAKNPVNYT